MATKDGAVGTGNVGNKGGNKGSKKAMLNPDKQREEGGEERETVGETDMAGAGDSETNVGYVGWDYSQRGRYPCHMPSTSRASGSGR